MTSEPEGTTPDPETAGEGVADEAVEVPTGEEEVVEEVASDDAPTEPTAEQQLAERTADLQRLQAEYVNYRKRVERDRAQARQQGEAAVLRSLLTVLDDIGRAEQHVELSGGFKAVADALTQALKAHKLEAFGAEGDPFDPRLHEALFAAGDDVRRDPRRRRCHRAGRSGRSPWRSDRRSRRRAGRSHHRRNHP